MDYEKFTLVELRQLAKEKGTKNVSKLKKDELITLLKGLENVGDNQVKESEKFDNQPDFENTISENSSSNTNYKVTNEDDNIVEGILEVLPDGYGFLRGKNYLSSPKDVYISPVKLKDSDLIKEIKLKVLQEHQHI